MQNRTNTKFRQSAFFLFILWPFGNLIYTLRNYRKPAAQLSFVLTMTFLGYHMNMVGDLLRYEESFYRFSDMSFGDFFGSVFSFRFADVYIPITAKFVSIFTNNVQFYFAFLMAIYAYFYSAIMRLFIERLPKKMSRGLLLLFLAFATYQLVRPFISTRFYTAVLVYLYAVLQVMINNKKRYAYLMLITPLIHFSFLILIPVLPFYGLFKKSLTIPIVMVILSFMVGQSNIVAFLENRSEQVEGTALYGRIEIYGSEEGIRYMDNRYALGNERANLKLKTLNYLRDYTYLFAIGGIVILILRRKRLTSNAYNYLVVILLIWSATNIILNLSNGFRFLHLLSFATVGLMLYLLLENVWLGKLYTWYVKIGIPIVLIYNIMALYAANALFNLNYFVSNYFIELLGGFQI